ncbi:unnamed protein product [Rotaria sordida]|uniref:MGS-like domain-containing protein n=1 Tax=Rotaria sordida TaxID=392033 RepID=A0A814TQI5_9BILA|nr:unnamed protein product [Rotaria sordida]
MLPSHEATLLLFQFLTLCNVDDSNKFLIRNGWNLQNTTGVRIMGVHKRIGFAAHNEKKSELIECLRKHRNILVQHKLYATGTTGSLIEKEFNVVVTKFNSGPLGGDQQLGAKIATGELDILIFLIDPLNAHAHAADIQALVRLAEVYNIPYATTATSVDFIFTSKMMNERVTRQIPISGYPKP